MTRVILSQIESGFALRDEAEADDPKSPHVGKTTPHVYLYIVFNRTQTGSDAGCPSLTLILQVQKGDKQMNAKGKTSIRENKPKISASTLMRWAGLSAIAAGLCFLVLGMFHPVNVPSVVTTAVWVNVHIFAFALGFFGLFGMAGLYARQAEKTGWLGLAGFLLFSVWMILVSGFSFVEAFILPKLATASPAFVEGFLGMFSGIPSEIDLGILPTLWNISGPMYILGPLSFGIATFRAGILPRWAGGLLALNIVWVPIGAVVPHQYQPWIMVPVGLALAWLGYALVSERRERASELAAARSASPEPSNVA
jgi:hypothetical protein